MNKFLIILFVVFSVDSYSQTKEADTKVEWNGYTQLRATSNFNDLTSFSLRRMKLWIKSTPEFSNHWSYKIQTTISSSSQEKFFLQDVKIAYTTGLFSFDFGQFLPQYSLQWAQSDYNIPTIERARVIDALFSNGSLGARDIGIQANFRSKNKLLETHLGIFNGYGIVKYNFDNIGYLITHKSALNIPIQKNQLQIGYSLQYRQAQNLNIPKVLPDSISFTGNDIRSNLFVRYQSKCFEFQAEYLNADLDGRKAKGYYFLSSINIKKSQVVFSYEDYHDLILETTDKPFYRFGYNYLINNHKLKLSFDTVFQMNNNKIENYISSIQLQMFFK